MAFNLAKQEAVAISSSGTGAGTIRPDRQL